jgi:hypothetical protein
LDSLAVVFSAFGSAYEPVRNAAAYALGNITVGNMGVYLPMVLELIKNTSDARRYLLLSSLKEIIVRHSNKHTVFLPHVPTVLPILFSHAEAKEGNTLTTYPPLCSSLLNQFIL